MVLQTQKAIIRQLKKLETGHLNSFFIPIKKYNGSIIGRLTPISKEMASESSVIERLAKWRQQYMKYFLTQFVASNERTYLWLNNFVIPDDTRILFLIQDEEGKLIGNFGTCNIGENEAELDNLIRGERGGDPKLIFFAEISLMDWLYQSLGVEDIYLHAFSNNSKTINLHTSVGFEKSQTYQLVKIETNQEIKYHVNQNQKLSNNEFGLLKMTIDKKRFLERYGRLE